MKQLSGLDASFLYMETPSQFGHVSSLSIFDKPDDPDYDPFSAWRAQIEARLHTLEPLRHRGPISNSPTSSRASSAVRSTALAPCGRRT
jgi:hypothetical protein